MRRQQRVVGTGAVVALTMVAGALPAAQAEPGPVMTSNGPVGIGVAGVSGLGPLIGPGEVTGSGRWLAPFQAREREVGPEDWPGRWGGYRGPILQAPGIEPPDFVEFPGKPLSAKRKPRPPKPSAPGPSPSWKPTTAPTSPAVPTDTAEPTAATGPTVTTGPTATAEPTATTGPTATADPTATTGPTANPIETTAPPATSIAPATKNRSGLPWASGIFARGQGVAGLEAFASWRGRPTDVVVDWPARRTWDDIVNPDWLYRTWQNTPYTKAFGVAPIPEGDPSATMAGCAAGAYNSKWRQFGQNLATADLADSTIIRLGWEFNGNWYRWSATDPGQFAECWRQIVDSVEPIAPGVRWDWNVNRGKGQSVPDARLAYPGDGYVDIVGVDAYDIWPGATDEASWQQQYAGPYGLKFWADFAAAHGKKLSVAEWGVYPGPQHVGHNGGDNAFYIAKMMEFFRGQGSALAYEAYFNETASYFAGSIFAPAQAPAAAAQYLKEITR